MEYYDNDDSWDEPSARRPKSTKFFGSAGFGGEQVSLQRSNSDPDLMQQQRPKKPSARRRGSVGMTTEAPRRRGSISSVFGPKRPAAPKSPGQFVRKQEVREEEGGGCGQPSHGCVV